MGFAMFFASHEASVDDIRQSDPPTDGGPPPPAVKGAGFPKEKLTFVNYLACDILLYAALWGPIEDGPPQFIMMVSGGAHEVFEREVLLPPLAHRTRLSAVSATSGE